MREEERRLVRGEAAEWERGDRKRGEWHEACTQQRPQRLKRSRSGKQRPPLPSLPPLPVIPPRQLCTAEGFSGVIFWFEMHSTSNCGYCVDHMGWDRSFVSLLNRASFGECGAAVESSQRRKIPFPLVFFIRPSNAKVLSRIYRPPRQCHILHVRVQSQLSVKVQKWRC